MRKDSQQFPTIAQFGHNSQERGCDILFFCSLKYMGMVMRVLSPNEGAGGWCSRSKACAYSGSEVNHGAHFHSRNTGCALIQQLIC